MDFAPRVKYIIFSKCADGWFPWISPTVDIAFKMLGQMRETLLTTGLSVPLPWRPLGDDSSTLGPQGGLAREMSIRGQPPMSNKPFAHDQMNSNDRIMSYGSREVWNPDRKFLTDIGQTQHQPKVGSQLRWEMFLQRRCGQKNVYEMSMEAIKEFYRYRKDLLYDLMSSLLKGILDSGM